MRDAERRGRYAINRAGGLSGAQKHYANIASILGTQSNIANMMSGIQEKNNQYKSQYASALQAAGDASARRRQAANEYAENYYAQAHAAKQQGKQMAMYNFLNQLNQYYSNEFKRNQFNNMMDMYRDNQKLDREKFDAWKKGLNKNNGSDASAPVNNTPFWMLEPDDSKPYPWYPGK
jgi:hypothetical protein